MFKRTVIAVLGAALSGFPAAAQPAGPVDPALLAQGEELFTADTTGCATCHQENGEGLPPDFPALAANDKLADLALIVGNIHRGAGAMPAFPDLTPEEIAALGHLRPQFLGQQLRRSEPAGGARDHRGATTADRAGVGVERRVLAGAGRSRQDRLLRRVRKVPRPLRETGPVSRTSRSRPLSRREAFLTKWEEQTVATLFEYVRTTMPHGQPQVAK